jgi:hypothetical protein
MGSIVQPGHAEIKGYQMNGTGIPLPSCLKEENAYGTAITRGSADSD